MEDGVPYQVFDGIVTVDHLSGGDLTLHLEGAVLCRNEHSCFAYCELVDLLEIELLADPGYEGQMDAVCGQAHVPYTALFGYEICASYYNLPCDGSSLGEAPGLEPLEGRSCDGE